MVYNNLKVDIVKAVLRKEGLSVIDMKDPFATLDASDVLFTGMAYYLITKEALYNYFCLFAFKITS